MAADRKVGRLVICPTPIGNLGDITQRTLDALRECDVVCAEDTRVTGKLLAAYGIEKRLERLDEAAIGAKASSLARRVSEGETVAYCSDAGMPGVSDPGLRLVRIFREEGIPVDVLPGASAAATAYVASGCTAARYYFGGFFPRKAGEQESLLSSLTDLDAALVFYESPQRVSATLAVLASAFPYREMAVCRELTKLHEEVIRGSTAELAAEFAHRVESGTVKGEIAIVVDGPSPREREALTSDAQDAARTRAVELHATGMRKKEIARTLADEYGISRNAAYEIALATATR